jgi:Domain of unknown function (DUF4157)
VGAVERQGAKRSPLHPLAQPKREANESLSVSEGRSENILWMQQVFGNHFVQSRASSCPNIRACPNGGACHTCAQAQAAPAPKRLLSPPEDIETLLLAEKALEKEEEETTVASPTTAHADDEQQPCSECQKDMPARSAPIKEDSTPLQSSGDSISQTAQAGISPNPIEINAAEAHPASDAGIEPDEQTEASSSEEQSLETANDNGSQTLEDPSFDEVRPEPPAASQEQSQESIQSVISPATIIVEDSTAEIGPGQMRKTEFMQALNTTVRSTADASLAGTEYSAADCPYIEFWLDYYSTQDSNHIQRAIRRYVPAAKLATTAAEILTLINGQVRQAVGTWVRTGQVVGLPDSVSPGVSGVSFAADSMNSPAKDAGVFFKERAGGAKAPDNPQLIQSQLGDGTSINSSVRSRMESAFGESFSRVRVHTDAEAMRLSEQHNARAFTVGEHIAFGSGEYQPGTPIGDALIAHELAHVVQQSGANTSAAPVQTFGAQYDALEEDADNSAIGAVVSLWDGTKGALASMVKNTKTTLRSGLRLQRCSRGSAPQQHQCACAEALTFKPSGALEGTYGINDYWTTVTPYWGTNNTLGQFDIADASGNHTLGHKFQVVGRFSRQTSTTASGDATFQQMARLTVGTAAPGTAGSWFDDMNYTDAGGGVHQWDVNAEAGTTATAGPGVRRTVAPDKYAYTDPPAIFYQPGVTNTYRKLEFDIHFRSAPGCPCTNTELTTQKTQEIGVVNGVPNVIQWP